MEVTINNYNELLEFIKKDEVNVKQATEIVCKALTVIPIFEMTKDEVVRATEYYINTYCQTAGERPLFLGQLSNLDFNIRDIFKSNEV